MGRYGREAQAPPQATITLTNPANVPPVGSSEFDDVRRAGHCRQSTTASSWCPSTGRRADPEAQDWDFFLTGPDGEPVGSGATLANPEVIRIPDPQPGTYTLEANNYAGGSAQYDWSGAVTFEARPRPARPAPRRPGC